MMKRKHFERGPYHSAKKFIEFLKPGSKVLDLGCGGGIQSHFFAQQGFETWGIDADPMEVKRAMESYEVPNLHFQTGRAEEIPFPAGFFDGIYSAAVLHSIPLERPAREIYRVAKDGAVIYLEFLLSYVSAERSRNFHTRRKIEAVYAKDFQISFLDEFPIDDPGSEGKPDVEFEPPHRHDILVLGLKKTSGTWTR